MATEVIDGAPIEVDPLLRPPSPPPPPPPMPPQLTSLAAAQFMSAIGPRIVVIAADLTYKTLTLAEMKELAAEWQKRRMGSTCWVDAQGLSEAEQHELQDALGISRAAAQVWESYQESFRNIDAGRFMTVMELVRDPDSGTFCEKPFVIACFPDLLFTAHALPTSVVNSTLSMLRQSRDKRHAPITINALIIFHLCATYSPLADNVQSQVENLGALVLQLPSREESDLLLRVTQTRSQLLLLSEAVFRKERVVKMSSINTEAHSRTHRKAMQSARNLLLRFRDSATLSQDLLVNVTSTYLGRVSLAEAESGARTGVITRHLNSMYVMMLPLLVVQGCFSMNVRVPGQLVENLDWFFGILAIQLAFVFVMFAILRRLNWF